MLPIWKDLSVQARKQRWNALRIFITITVDDLWGLKLCRDRIVAPSIPYTVMYCNAHESLKNPYRESGCSNITWDISRTSPRNCVQQQYGRISPSKVISRNPTWEVTNSKHHMLISRNPYPKSACSNFVPLTGFGSCMSWKEKKYLDILVYTDNCMSAHQRAWSNGPGFYLFPR